MKKTWLIIFFVIFVFPISFFSGCANQTDEPKEIIKTEETNDNSTTNTPTSPTTPEIPTTPTEPCIPETPEEPIPAPVVKYTITFYANSDEASGSTESITADADSTITLTENGFSLTGFNFIGWNTAADGSGTGYSDGASLKLSSNLTLYAQWLSATVPTYTIEIAPIEHGIASVSQTIAEAGTEISITVTPDELYAFDTISVINADGSNITPTVNPENENIYKFTIGEQDVSVNVTFKYVAHSISVNPVENGKVTVNKVAAKTGDEIQITLEPNIDYALNTISVTDTNGNIISISLDSQNNKIYTFLMSNSNIFINVTYKSLYHSLIINPAQNGTIKAGKTYGSDILHIQEGEEVWIKLTPNTLYGVESIFVTGEDNTLISTSSLSNNRYTFIMPSQNVTINATFKYVAHSITFVASQNGTVTCDVTNEIEGISVIFTALPDKYYKVNAITVIDENNNSIECSSLGDSKFFFKMPDKNVTVNVPFGLATYQVLFHSVNLRLHIVQNIQGGNVVTPVYLETEEDLEKYKDRDPSKEFKCEGFLGWFTTQQCTEESRFDFNTPIDKSIDLYAKWEKITGSQVALRTVPPYYCEIKIYGKLDYDYIYHAGLNSDNGLVTLDLSDSDIGGDVTFEGCKSIKNIILPNDYDFASKFYFFKNCSNLISITLPDNTTTIKQEVFSGCSSLSTITIPRNVDCIENNAFESCNSLENVIFEDTTSRWKVILEGYSPNVIGSMSATNPQYNANMIKQFSNYYWLKISN